MVCPEQGHLKAGLATWGHPEQTQTVVNAYGKETRKAQHNYNPEGQPHLTVFQAK